MNKYLITNNKDNEKYYKTLENETEVRHWIINTLDTSKEWTILKPIMIFNQMEDK